MSAFATIYNALCGNVKCEERFTSQKILDVVVDISRREAFFVTECTRCHTENRIAVSALPTAYRVIPDLRSTAKRKR